MTPRLLSTFSTPTEVASASFPPPLNAWIAGAAVIVSALRRTTLTLVLRVAGNSIVRLIVGPWSFAAKAATLAQLNGFVRC